MPPRTYVVNRGGPAPVVEEWELGRLRRVWVCDTLREALGLVDAANTARPLPHGTLL
jgi:hypothetical protein